VIAFNKLSEEYGMPVAWSIHPHTKRELDKNKNIKLGGRVVPLEPIGFFDFNKLQKNAFCVLSDSGTAQEECAIYNVPVVTLRDVTERPETLDAGCNFLSGCDVDAILRGVKIVTESGSKWQAPPEYLKENVSDTVVRIILGYWR
jgi:UDP-N-acetylglucosamine 2-epimerase (non-hydrolysing)